MTTQTECGIARNTAAAIQFLDSCPAVREHVELSADWIEFRYDPSVEVSTYPEHLVWWDEGAAPDEATAALNAFAFHECDECGEIAAAAGMDLCSTCQRFTDLRDAEEQRERLELDGDGT